MLGYHISENVLALPVKGGVQRVSIIAIRPGEKRLDQIIDSVEYFRDVTTALVVVVIGALASDWVASAAVARLCLPPIVHAARMMLFRFKMLGWCSKLLWYKRLGLMMVKRVVVLLGVLATLVTAM